MNLMAFSTTWFIPNDMQGCVKDLKISSFVMTWINIINYTTILCSSCLHISVDWRTCTYADCLRGRMLLAYFLMVLFPIFMCCIYWLHCKGLHETETAAKVSASRTSTGMWHP